MRPRGWETFFALLAGLSAGLCLRGDFFDHAASQIVTLLSLLMAAVVPTMILSVNSMRSSIFSVQQIINLRANLHKQVSMLGGLFIHALAACILIILAVSTNWPSWHRFAPFTALIAFLLVFLAARSFTVIFGIQGLLQLAGDLAENEAKAREIELAKIDDLDKYEQPKDYGAPIDIPH